MFVILGLRVAQVQLIFKLPPQFGYFFHPLTYIEWFTQFGQFDPNSGLYCITCSTQHNQRNAEIISVERIVRGCHLMARCGSNVLSSWTSDNILEEDSIQYLFNPYINVV